MRGLECKADGCTNEQRERGAYCGRCAARRQRHGDATVVKSSAMPGERNGRWKAVPGENAAHKRVYAVKGKAADHSCVSCGEQAEEWAYDHADPNELQGKDLKTRQGNPYSLDPNHYQPRCVACHRLFDATHSKERKT